MIAVLIWGEIVRPDSWEGLANFNEVKMEINGEGRKKRNWKTLFKVCTDKLHSRLPC